MSWTSVLGTLAGAVFNALASATIGVFKEWLTKRRIRQNGRQDAVLEYERANNRAQERLRKVQSPTSRDLVKRLRSGSL